LLSGRTGGRGGATFVATRAQFRSRPRPRLYGEDSCAATTPTHLTGGEVTMLTTPPGPWPGGDAPAAYSTALRFSGLDSVERTDQLGGLLNEYRVAA